MKILYMGTPTFARVILERLLESHHEILAVFTQPDKPQGRKKIITAPPVKTFSEQHGIPVYQPDKLTTETMRQLQTLNPDCIVVAAYGKILPAGILNIPPYGAINVHASLLPKYRGAAPIQRAILSGEKQTGITTMYMDEGLDTGDICLQESLEIGENETSEQLFERLSALGGKVLLETLDLLETGKAPRIKQDESQSSYAPMLTKEEGKIDFHKPAREIHNLIRGLNPWPIAYTYWEGKKLKIFSSTVKEQGGPPGMLLDDKQMIIGCQEGSLQIKTLQLEGGKKMESRDFLNGRRLPKGWIFKGEK